MCVASSIISLCYRASRRLFNRLTSPAVKRSEFKKSGASESEPLDYKC